MDPGRVISYRAQTAAQADRYCYYLEKSSLLETERKSITDKSRRLYKQYCMQCRYQPSVRDEKTDKKLERMMLFVAAYEAEMIASLEAKSLEGISYDIEAMVSEERYIRCLVNGSMKKLAAQYTQEHSAPAENRKDSLKPACFATKTGVKFHREGCGYCKGKILFPVSPQEIEERKLTPCRCTEAKIVNTEKIEGGDRQPQAVKPAYKKPLPVMTAFIDETIRPNRLHEWNQKIPAETAMFSYIICRGDLNSEKQITNKNRVESGIGLVTGTGSKGVERVAMEAMSQVLLKIAGQFDFFDEVVIYTDNLSAKNLWSKKRIAKKISSMFRKVTVHHIDRKNNTAADRVGRQRTILEIPAETLDKMVQELKNVKALGDYQRRMHQCFPNSEINVENLIEELEDLLQEITERKKKADLRDCGPQEPEKEGKENVCNS